MIFDRTQEDIDKARELRENKVKKFVELTEDEKDILERGTLTINTLNRIEDKQQELKHVLNDMGYWNINISNRNWAYSDIFDSTEWQRIIDNTKLLRDGFFVFSKTPSTPLPEYHFETLNSIECILHDVEEVTKNIKNSYMYCGNLFCGEAQEEVQE